MLLPRKLRAHGLGLGLGLALSLAPLSFLGGCATSSGIGDSLGLSPDWEWKTLETEHFRLSFPQELAEVARKSARYLEEAHSFLSPELHWTPRLKTQVLVIDNEDAANGLTSPTGRFGMVFLVTPPENWFSTYYYDDWLRLLAIHEYTHFLNMDVTTDYSAVLRIIFGDVTLPNTAWPTWMLEGLAVYMETRFTQGGRGRSPFYEMILRSAVENGVLDRPDFITLDRINGDHPYYPAGETAYLFGFHLMNQVAKNPSKDFPGGKALGEMSLRSSRRIPYLINGNLEDISGKDWYTFWDEWVKETRARTVEELKTLRAQPLTPFKKITSRGRVTLGSAFSSDGKWGAYTQDSLDQEMSLWLLERKEGAKPRALVHKIFGGTVAFTPDSKAVVYSALHRNSHSTLYSDLAVYDLETDSTQWITDGARARDPDVSRDGKWVVYSIARNATTGIAIAPLEKNEHDYRLGPQRLIYMPETYDAVHSPIFSQDGTKVIFTLHRNGTTGEELMELPVATQDAALPLPRALVSDGNFNRFPTLSPDGTIHFVSDRNGVDNVYRLDPATGNATAVTHVASGVWFPSFTPEGRLYASFFSPTGWDLAEMDSPEGKPSPRAETLPSIRPSILSVAPPEPAPSPSSSSPEISAAQDYSVFPSLWPRQWSPLLVLSPQGSYLGAEALGFDAIDTHSYLAALGYNTELRQGDIQLLYNNRTLGPTLSFFFGNQVTAIQHSKANSLATSFTRNLHYQLSISYPILWTDSALTPSFSLNTERSTYYSVKDSGESSVDGQSAYVPNLDLAATFTNARGSPLAISAEEGRFTSAGMRRYLNLDKAIWKGILKDREYLRLGEHSVLIPYFKAAWVSDSSNYSPTYVNVQSRPSSFLFGPFAKDNFDEMTIRGYPNQVFYARSEQSLALDYRFPLWRIFRGWGTQPVSADYLYGFTFAEFNYFPHGEPGATLLPSAGGGLRLQGKVLFQLPMTFSMEYHQGFESAAGGAGEMLFFMGIGTNGI